MTHGYSHYTVLQVDPGAEHEVIESAYRRLARKYHPDVNNSPEAAARMRAINQAYAALSSPSQRVVYDLELRQCWSRQRLGPRPLHPSELDPRLYRAAIEPVERQVSACMGKWAVEWASSLEEVLAGDVRARQRAAEAGQRCLLELTDCLARWEALVPPPTATRLGDLGAACLKLELALVRGTLSFAGSADFSVLEPLAGLGECIHALTRTIAAEVAVLYGSASDPEPGAREGCQAAR